MYAPPAVWGETHSGPPTHVTHDPKSARMDHMDEKRGFSKSLSRREVLRRISGAWISAPIWKWGKLPFLPVSQGQQDTPSAPSSRLKALSPEDDLFLEELERATVAYFWDQANPQTGLVKDRCNVRAADNTVVASIAATGFGLTALCIGDKRKYIHFFEARRRALNTLMFLWQKMPQHRGFFYHFADIKTGERLWDSEISSVDTAILLCGVLACAQHFDRFRNSATSRAPSLTAWIGLGSRWTLACCPTDGCRRTASCRIVGTITVN